MTGPAILTHEKAAGAVAAAADGMTPQEGIEMNTAIIAQDVEIHESLRHLMVDGDYDVRQPNPTHMPLPKGDALWSDQENPRRAKHEEKGESFYLVAVYDLATGERLFEGTRAPLGWWGERIGTFDYQTFGRFHPNTYVRSGAYLFVSGGLWFAVGRPDENGDIAYVSWHASNALVRAGSAERLAAWLAAKAEPISQASPSWADVSLTWAEIVEEDEDDDVDFMQFRRRVGTVVIEQSFNIDDGVFSPASAPQVCIDTSPPIRTCWPSTTSPASVPTSCAPLSWCRATAPLTSRCSPPSVLPSGSAAQTSSPSRTSTPTPRPTSPSATSAASRASWA
jgi:hypothetical protein